jgi:hypothetical protein
MSHAYGIMDKADFDNLGKQMEGGTGRDCSIEGQGEGNSEEANKKRKARQAEAAANKAARTSTATSEDSLAKVIADAAQKELNVTIWQFMFLNGSDAQKADACAKLLGMTTDGQPVEPVVRTAPLAQQVHEEEDIDQHQIRQEIDSDDEEEQQHAAFNSPPVMMRGVQQQQQRSSHYTPTTMRGYQQPNAMHAEERQLSAMSSGSSVRRPVFNTYSPPLSVVSRII